MAKVQLHLFSELEGRVPHAAYQKFFLERIQEFFGAKRIELHPYGFPAGLMVWGDPNTIKMLEERLKR